MITLKTNTEHFMQLEGDSAFVRAVNRKISLYWVASGRSMNLEAAMFEVLADLYDEIKDLNPKEGE